MDGSLKSSCAVTSKENISTPTWEGQNWTLTNKGMDLFRSVFYEGNYNYIPMWPFSRI